MINNLNKFYILFSYERNILKYFMLPFGEKKWNWLYGLRPHGLTHSIKIDICFASKQLSLLFY